MSYIYLTDQSFLTWIGYTSSENMDISKFDEYLDLFWDIIIIFDDVISHAPWPVLLDLDRPNPRKQDNFPSYIQITRYMQE